MLKLMQAFCHTLCLSGYIMSSKVRGFGQFSTSEVNFSKTPSSETVQSSLEYRGLRVYYLPERRVRSFQGKFSRRIGHGFLYGHELIGLWNIGRASTLNPHERLQPQLRQVRQQLQDMLFGPSAILETHMHANTLPAKSSFSKRPCGPKPYLKHKP